MTIEFKEEQIVEREKEIREPYIGYFDPSGNLIDYNVLLGGNYHDAWRNPVSLSFLSWVSYIVEGTSIEKLKEWAMFPQMITNNQYPEIDEYVKRGYEYNYDFNYESFDIFLNRLQDFINSLEDDFKKYGGLSGYEKFRYDLLLFFKNAYKNRRFFDSIQRKISIENPDIVKEKIKHKFRDEDLEYGRLDSYYRDYLKEELLSYLKDICVQYLGYDSLERFKPNGQEIEIPYWGLEYNFNFLDNPRIISSSYPNINERYYNYLLMDWSIHRLPKYSYNEKTGIYEKESNFSFFYQSENEEKLEKEIQSIKKLVPRKDRYKYFR